MPMFIKYYPNKYERHQLIEDLKIIRDKGYDGVFYCINKPYETGDLTMKFFPVARMIELTKLAGLKAGIILDCFQNPFLWQMDIFSPPVNYLGTAYTPQKGYYPVCPNNPIGHDFYHLLLQKTYRLGQIDYCMFENLRFPFFWQEENLDIQHHVPPYCYCPFCVTEFSSMVGEVVSFTSQIVEMLPDWLEWRSGIIANLVYDACDALIKKTKIIISTPPLALIDLPFATGQLPMAYVDNGCLISPALYHPSKMGNILWVEDILDQYRIEFKMTKLFPTFKVQSENEIKQYLAIDSTENFAGLLFDNWQSLKYED
jgi:hypothetical protein